MNMMMRRIFPILCGLALVAVSAAQNDAASGTQQNSAERRTVKGVLDGPRAVVFDSAKDSCEQIDVPDAMARAFRDYKGTVHLVASIDVLRQNLGSTLLSAKHSCQVAYISAHDSHPAHFNDSTWLDSFYSLDGKRIVALGHTEYHGWEHTGWCHLTNGFPGCEYDADTYHLSDDGGYHFKSLKAPANFFVGIPYKYEIDKGPSGYSVDTNIVKVGKWYYAMSTSWQWPQNCTADKRPQHCLTPLGGAPIRTSNLLDVSSWRSWDGKDFSVSFVDPYLGPVKHPQDHVYTPVPYMAYVTAINIYEPAHLFVATLFDGWDTTYGPEGLYLSTSTDLIHWTKPTLVVTQAQLLAKEPKGNWSYAYFTLLDPRSKDANFSGIGKHPYVYYVRLDNNNPPYTRVLFRQRVKLTLNQ
jgi:hypothetical protein